jgi:hypothetical protein
MSANENHKFSCPAPWRQLWLAVDGQASACDRITEGYGSLHQEDIASLINGSKAQELRRVLLEGRRPEACQACWKAEDAGSASLRQALIADKDHLFTPLHKPTTLVSVQTDIESAGIQFSNLCMSRCRSCSPIGSSTLARELKKLAPESLGDCDVRLSSAGNLQDALSSLENIRRYAFLGGEVLIDPDHLFFLDDLASKKPEEIELRYTTNHFSLQWNDHDFIKIWRKFRAVGIALSLDGSGKQGELLRKGLRYGDVESALLRLRASGPPIYPSIICTVSVMNAFHITDAISEWISAGWVQGPKELIINLLRTPRHLSINILDRSERERLKDHYRNWLLLNVTHWSRDLHRSIEIQMGEIISFLSEEPWLKERKAFRYLTFTFDRSREESFIGLFPEHFNLLYGPSLL